METDSHVAKTEAVQQLNRFPSTGLDTAETLLRMVGHRVNEQEGRTDA